MKNVKDELQNIILGDEQTGTDNRLKKTQNFLRGYAQASYAIEKQQRFKDQEAAALVTFAAREDHAHASYQITKKARQYNHRAF
jgi:hypothetical protein